jgi:hypothetical protein
MTTTHPQKSTFVSTHQKATIMTNKQHHIPDPQSVDENKESPRRRTDFPGLGSSWWSWLILILVAIFPFPWWS